VLPLATNHNCPPSRSLLGSPFFITFAIRFVTSIVFVCLAQVLGSPDGLCAWSSQGVHIGLTLTSITNQTNQVYVHTVSTTGQSTLSNLHQVCVKTTFAINSVTNYAMKFVMSSATTHSAQVLRFTTKSTLGLYKGCI
jgi:hypothetical protein